MGSRGLVRLPAPLAGALALSGVLLVVTGVVAGVAPARDAARVDASPTSAPVVPAPAPSVAPAPSGNPQWSAATPTPTPVPAVPATKQYFITGYSYWDNDPPGSSAIADPVVHTRAGGTGTVADPITVAVGATSGIRPGARLYLPRLHKYLVVEDECASCSGAWLDLWVDGSASRAASESCMASITGLWPVVPDPPAGLPVVVGPISGPRGCTPLHPATLAP